MKRETVDFKRVDKNIRRNFKSGASFNEVGYAVHNGNDIFSSLSKANAIEKVKEAIGYYKEIGRYKMEGGKIIY